MKLKPMLMGAIVVSLVSTAVSVMCALGGSRLAFNVSNISISAALFGFNLRSLILEYSIEAWRTVGAVRTIENGAVKSGPIPSGQSSKKEG